MLHNVFLSFQEKNFVMTQKQLFTSIQDTFTIEFWAKPNAAHEIDTQSRKGILGTSNKRYVILPIYGELGSGNSLRAGVGVSVGTNGVSVYEHSTNYLAATLVLETQITNWTHFAVVYRNKTPTLYINGQFVKKGLPSSKRTVVPSGVLGGMQQFGSYVGDLKEVRIWSTARSQPEIVQNMNRELIGNEAGLFVYWKMNEGTGLMAKDSTINGNNGSITGAKWKTLQRSANLQNKRTNILFTFVVPSGGVETLNRQRYYALNKKGINCHFLYTQTGMGLLNKLDTSIFVTNNDREIKEIILKGQYEAIVVNSDYHMLQKIRSFGYKGPLIYEIQGLGLNKEHANYFLKYAYSMINKHCDAFLYPKTPHLIQAIESNFPLKKKYCFNNCFNTQEFNHRVHPKNDKPIIGWVGRLEENKNWKDFLLIGAELMKENSFIQLWMFEDNTLGKKSERIAFEQKIDKLNLRKNLTVYANQPHYKMADHLSIIGDSGGLLCSTSKIEGFGYAVLEAMVCKCPVLSTDSDGVRSLIKHNDTGKFFELGNINQAAQEAKGLMKNHELREKIRRKGVEHIKLHFSLDKYAENFLNMIKHLRN